MNTLQISGNIENDGAIVDIQIFKSQTDFKEYFKNKNLAIPYCSAKAMIDTGAGRTSISEEFILKLQLESLAEAAKTESFGGTVRENKQYNCLLYNPIFKQRAIPLAVLGNEFKHCPYNAIIGRDLLVDFTLIYDGWSNSFRLINIKV